MSKELMEKYIQEGQKRVEDREENLLAHNNKPPNSFFKQKDVSVKKNSALVKKLRGFAELQDDQKKGIISQLQQLNFTRYVEEAAVAISLLIVPDVEIDNLADICVYLHRNYDFQEIFLAKLKESLEEKKEINKLKTVIRLLATLYTRGVIQDVELLYSLLNETVKTK
jgi:regulator of nonsense transcripts 2